MEEPIEDLVLEEEIEDLEDIMEEEEDGILIGGGEYQQQDI